ncbi:MAG: thioredoxin family protein [Bacillota bacterium]
MAKMVIKVLGSGCANCKKLEEHAREAVAQAGIEAEVVKVTDMAAIMSYGIMRTPGLVVNERVLVSGRVPDTAEVRQLLSSI